MRIRFYYQGVGWRCAKAVITLGRQVEVAWPERQPADGTVASGGHAKWPASDHGIDPHDLVRAIDVGTVGDQGAVLSEQLRASEDPRLAYVIHDRRIFSSTVSPWQWRPYTGHSPHAGHVHVSMMRDPRAEDPEPFDLNLGGATMLTIEQLQEALNEAGQTDQGGNSLLIDGDYGPATKFAHVNGLKDYEVEAGDVAEHKHKTGKTGGVIK